MLRKHHVALIEILRPLKNTQNQCDFIINATRSDKRVTWSTAPEISLDNCSHENILAKYILGKTTDGQIIHGKNTEN